MWAVGAFRPAGSTSAASPAARPPSGRSSRRSLGLLLVGVFVVGSLVVREIDPLADYVSAVLEYADQGSVPVLVVITLVNGIAEELFFRGAAYAAIPRHPVAGRRSPTSSRRSRPAT